MDVIKVYYDVETTGTNPNKHSLHQIAGLIEINNEVVGSFDIHSRPHAKAILDPEALKICKVTPEQLNSYLPMLQAKNKFCSVLSKFIDKYNVRSKAYLVGFNNRGFDDKFLRMWFALCDDVYLGSWFWSDTRDASVLASEYLESRRLTLPDFQLHTVAKSLGLEVDQSRLHDAAYDVTLTRQIYRIVTGREIEL